MNEQQTCSGGTQVDKYLRGVAGAFLMLSVVLFHYHSQHWIWFTGFIGINLFQSAFTKWCPMMFFLRKLGKKG